jgi:hypothetical protein
MIDPVFDDGMRLATADLHEHPRFSDYAPDFANYFLRQRFVSIFIEVFHMDPYPPSSDVRDFQLGQLTHFFQEPVSARCFFFVNLA